MNRQERREQGKEYEMECELFQPWSVPVMKTTLPPNVLQTMIEISDLVIADKEAESAGNSLVGQIDTELLIENNILEQTGVMGFFIDAVYQFGIQCKYRMFPYDIKKIQGENWLTQILSMWIVSQQPGEYNPLHMHTQCQISTIMYLKVPKMLPDRKKHTPPFDDGSIIFVSNASRDVELSCPDITIPPQVGDFYIFGAQQQHAVNPYRCEEGQEDVERRSISFNATFQSKTKYDTEQKYLQNETKK